MSESLTDQEEVLFRQINPSWLEEDGHPSSQPFRPTPKDNNKLSVDRSALTDAASSFALFTASGLPSVAVYGVSVGEFKAETISCIPDPLQKTDAQAENPAHAYADYSSHGTNKQKNISQRLKRKALERGRLHPAP